MAYIKLLRHVRDINKSIEEIREHHIKPVTATTMADIADVVLAKRGTSSEGRILPLAEVNERLVRAGEKPLTRNQYNTYINDLIESLGSQLTYEGALDYAYDIGRQRLKTFLIDNKERPDLMALISRMTKQEIVDLLDEIGNKTNFDEKAGYSSDSQFSNYLIYELEEYFDTKLPKIK